MLGAESMAPGHSPYLASQGESLHPAQGMCLLLRESDPSPLLWDPRWVVCKPGVLARWGRGGSEPTSPPPPPPPPVGGGAVACRPPVLKIKRSLPAWGRPSETTTASHILVPGRGRSSPRPGVLRSSLMAAGSWCAGAPTPCRRQQFTRSFILSSVLSTTRLR